MQMRRFEFLEDGRIRMFDHLFKICDQEVPLDVQKLEKDVIAPRTEIKLLLDSTFAVNVDLRQFVTTGLDLQKHQFDSSLPFSLLL